MDLPTWILIILVPVLIGVALYAYANHFIFINPSEKEKKEKASELVGLGGIERFSVGKYVTGLVQWDEPTLAVDCVVTNDHFIFTAGIGKEMGRIPRNTVNQIIVDDKSQITQRLTVTRMLTLGIFSLAAPKKAKHVEFCILDRLDRCSWNTEQHGV